MSRKIAAALIALSLLFGFGAGGFAQHGYQAGELEWCENC